MTTTRKRKRKMQEDRNVNNFDTYGGDRMGTDFDTAGNSISVGRTTRTKKKKRTKRSL